jgi:hypothetical protein
MLRTVSTFTGRFSDALFDKQTDFFDAHVFDKSRVQITAELVELAAVR